jgi:hypothetical protein
MKRRTKQTIIELFVVFVASVLIAFFLEQLGYSNRLTFLKLPGDPVAHYLVPAPPPPHELNNLGLQILLGFAIDVARCFALIVGLLVVVRRLLRYFSNRGDVPTRLLP